MWQLRGSGEHLVGFDSRCLAGLARGWRDYPSYVTNSLGPALAEHHALACLEVLRVLNEAEVHASLVPRPQALLGHRQDAGRLPDASAMHYSNTP